MKSGENEAVRMDHESARTLTRRSNVLQSIPAFNSIKVRLSLRDYDYIYQ